MFNLLNKEFTFTVDDSELDCGLNGALYFVEMQRDGGLSEYPTNGAGAAYGTGYCDAQVSVIQKTTGPSDRMSHRKWRETKQQLSRARSGHQISCCLVSCATSCPVALYKKKA